MQISRTLTAACCIAVLSGCAVQDNRREDVEHQLLAGVLDRKTTVVDVETCGEGRVCVATTDKQVAETAKSIYAADVRLLPDNESLEGFSVGIVRVPVAALHRRPAFSSEIVSEAVMGTPVYLLEKRGWWRVQTPEGYHAWIHRQQVYPVNEKEFAEFFQNSIRMVSALETLVVSDNRGELITSLPQGALVRFVKHEKNQVLIALPDGRTGWVNEETLVNPEALPKETDETLRRRIAQNALKLKGRSYRWAGTTPWAMDCSGLIKAAWLAAGHVGPRDADEMAAMPGSILKNPKDLQVGDLLFFGKGDRVGHVGISLGNTRFIHSLGDVHTADLNPVAPDYDAWAEQTFLFGLRPKVTGGCIRPMMELELFQGRVAAPRLCDIDIRR